MNKNINEKILIIYLPTGSGHLSNAKALKAEFVRQGYSDVKLYDPISPFSALGKFLMGTGYMIASQKIPMIWNLIYRGDESRLGCCLTHLIGLVFSFYGMLKICREYKPTRIVCTHAIPVYAVKYCAKKYRIPVSIVITDPFDPPRVWWDGHTFDLFCYSKEAGHWLEQHGVPARRIHAYNLLVQGKYFTPMKQDQIAAFMLNEGFNPEKPLVLMVGGGDGLPKAIKIFRRLVISKKDFQLAVICGRDIDTYNILTLLSIAYEKKRTIRIYGFVSTVYELMNSAHIVIIKAGPSVIAEALALKKPMLIASSLPGQEWPNIHWVTKHQLGFYCYKPSLVKKRVEELLQDPIKYDRLKQRLKQYDFKNTLPTMAGDILTINRVMH